VRDLRNAVHDLRVIATTGGSSIARPRHSPLTVSQ